MRPSRALAVLALFAACADEGSSDTGGTTGTTGGSTDTTNLTTSISGSDGSTTQPADGSSSSSASASSSSSDDGGVMLPCEPPTEVPAACADVQIDGAPLLDPWAAGIVVEANRAALTFANVGSTAILCEEAPLATCDDCPGWMSSARFSVLDPLTVQSYSPADVQLQVATNGDCDAPEVFPIAVMTFEVTDITEDCVGGHAVIQGGLQDFPTDFWFLAPRC